jgi:hypothetical protein
LLNVRGGGFPHVIETMEERDASENLSPARRNFDPELVRQSIAVLQAYLDHAGAQLEPRPPGSRHAGRALQANGNGHLRMSREEALELLGLGPTASAQEIRDAHRRLAQRVDPQSGGTPYLLIKIDEARSILLGE